MAVGAYAVVYGCEDFHETLWHCYPSIALIKNDEDREEVPSLSPPLIGGGESEPPPIV